MLIDSFRDVGFILRLPRNQKVNQINISVQFPRESLDGYEWSHQLLLPHFCVRGLDNKSQRFLHLTYFYDSKTFHDLISDYFSWCQSVQLIWVWIEVTTCIMWNINELRIAQRPPGWILAVLPIFRFSGIRLIIESRSLADGCAKYFHQFCAVCRLRGLNW